MSFNMDKIALTDEQSRRILELWNNPDSSKIPGIKELTGIIFPDISEEMKDGRSVYGRTIRTFLAERNLKARATSEYQAKERVDLSDEQKEFILKNVSTMSSVELARTLFKNETLTNLNIEARIVNDYIKTLSNIVAYSTTEEVPDGEYRPPKTPDRILARINKYVLDGIDKDKVSPQQRKEMTSLISYLHTYRFLHQINSYSSQGDRDLFESSFVRYCYDKSDLTQEEVDQYIILCTEVIISSNIQQTIQMIQMQIDSQIESEGKIPMTLIEASNSARNEYNQCVTRQQKLLNDLKVKRSDRLSKNIKENASILNLVYLWKEEETRKKMIRLAETRKAAVKEEIDRLMTIDEIKCKIVGLSEDQILHE